MAEPADRTSGLTTGNGAPGHEDGHGLHTIEPEGRRVDRLEHPELHDGWSPAVAQLTELEQRLLGDLFAIVEEHAGDETAPIDRERVERAFEFAC